MSSARELLVQALRQLMKPLARLSVRNGLVLRDLYEGLKECLVEEAIAELEKRGQTATVSQLSVMTGVHRKDVNRIVNSVDDQPREPSFLGKILARWQTDEEFQNKVGQPRVLSYEGRESDFSKLVFSITRELNPSIILRELERIGAIKKTKSGLKLNLGVYVPSGNFKQALRMLANDTGDLWDCVQENVTETPHKEGEVKLPNLHIRTDYDAIPDERMQKVREWLLKEGTDFHERVQKFLSRQDKELNKELAELEGNNRVAITSFSVSGSRKETH